MENKMELKVLSAFFDAIADGRKTAEIRRDHGYRQGDVIRLVSCHEDEDGAWVPDEDGDSLDVRVTWVTRKCKGLVSGFCEIQFEVLTEGE